MKLLGTHLSIDCVILGFDGINLKVLLEKQFDRVTQKYKKLKLPGSLVYESEVPDTAANRILYEHTGLINIYLQQFRTFGSIERTQNNFDLEWLRQTLPLQFDRIVTIAYYAMIKTDNFDAIPSNEWVDIRSIPELAFDHKEIIESAMQSIRKEIQHEAIEFELLPKNFTIRQYQNLHESIYNQSFDSRNFRKKINKLKYIQPLNIKEKGVAHKPAQLYRFNKKEFIKQKANL